uniref:hypothetical protein n=1 Tax=Cyclobacterium amurskyense TaxID=320787 RepID=UPI0030DCFED6
LAIATLPVNTGQASPLTIGQDGEILLHNPGSKNSEVKEGNGFEVLMRIEEFFSEIIFSPK